jgi:hypothetical protein
MTASDYKNAGYGLSQLIDQAVITRAENDVISAYLVPLLGHVPMEGEKAVEPVKTAFMGLSFLLIQQRSITATRAGAKTKLSEQSNTPTYDDLLRQSAPTCVRYLSMIDEDAYKKVSDICRVFFTTNYFYSRN